MSSPTFPADSFRNLSDLIHPGWKDSPYSTADTPDEPMSPVFSLPQASARRRPLSSHSPTALQAQCEYPDDTEYFKNSPQFYKDLQARTQA